MTTSYKPPRVEVEQLYENESTPLVTTDFNVCIVGPIYEMHADERHTVSYDGTSDVHVLYDTSFPVDIRKIDPEDDELLYTPEVTMKKAYIARYSGGAATIISNKLSDMMNPFTWIMNNPHKIRISSCDFNHPLSDPIDITTGAVSVITFDTPVALSIDQGSTYYNPAHPTETFTVASISSDRKTLTLSGAYSDNVIDSGHYTYQTAFGGLSDYYSVSRVDNSTLSVSGLPSGVSFTNVMYFLYEIKDVVLNPLFVTIEDTGVTIKQTATDSTGYAISLCEEISIKYRALKTTLTNTLTRIDISTFGSDITSKLDSVVNIYNTGVFATYNTCLNTKIDVYVCGVDENWFTNRQTSFMNADAFLREQSGIYHIVPLSQTIDTHTIFDSEVKFCSTKEEGLWRVTWLSSKLHTTKGIVEGTASMGFKDGSFQDPAGDFSNVTMNDVIKIDSWSGIVPTQVKTNDYSNITASFDPSTKILSFDDDLSELYDLSISEIVGKSLMIEVTGVGASFTPTSSDNDVYTDATHVTGWNAKTFADLGYRVSNAINDTGANTASLTLEAVGDSVNLNQTASSSIHLIISTYDSILPKYIEDTIRKNGFTVLSKYSNTELIYTNYTMSTVNYTGVEYSVQHIATKDEQAHNAGLYTSSYASFRTRFVWPDRMETSDGTVARGYFLAAEIAGAYSGMPVQEALTNHYITSSGYKLLHSNNYFSKSQLNEVAGGGITIMTQSTDGSRPKCRQQLSSDMSTIYYREPTIAHEVDKYSYYVKNMFSKLIGVYNMTQQLIDVATLYHESIVKTMLKPLPRVGSEVKSINLVAMRLSATELDFVECETEVIPTVPCNGFKVTVHVK